ncbi:MAG: peroxiredoxin family protein [Candidatus Binatia bacterium]
MCREQLVKLRPHVKELEAEGAAVFALSMDTAKEASKLAQDLSLAFPVLVDPNMGIVRAYGMYGKQMRMPEMGYTVIDTEGRIRTEEVDREFGEHANAILRALRRAKSKI